MQIKPCPCCLAAASLYALLTMPAASQDASTQAPPTERGWRIDAGAGVLAYPVYPGAKSETVLPVPSIEIHHGEDFFASLREGVGYNLFRWNGFAAGPVVNFAFPRSESDERVALKGLGNVDFTVEAGGFLRYNFGQIASAKVEVRRGVNGHEGLIVDTGLDLNAPPLFDNRLFLSAGPRFTYYDQNYARAYFGVTETQSLQSGYAAFQPGGGYKAGAGAGAVYLITDRVSLAAFADYGRLLGDIGKSPIVRGRYGSQDQFTLGTSLTYRFDFGG